MIQKQSHRNFEIKGAHEANLYISGYASVFNIEDRHGDVIVPGAFHNVAKQRKIKFLWQHDQTKPIGVINNFYEDSKGLFIEATINGSTQYGKDAKSLIEQGAIGAFSIGFNANKFYICLLYTSDAADDM
jgi:HK97 family phage prohead protease